MHHNLLPCIRMMQRYCGFAHGQHTGHLAELRDDKFGDNRCTEPNLADFGLSGLHHIGMYGIILH